MNIEIHLVNGINLAEITAKDLVIRNAADGLDVLGNLYYQGFDRVILYEKQLTPDFFDLKTGIAGEVLQKFSNYRIKLAIVGDFSNYKSPRLHEWIRESNRGRQVNFVSSQAEAIAFLARS